MTDLRYALRGLLRSPGFTAVAVLSLALGLGANVTIYTIASSFLNRTVPGTANPETLVRIYRGHHSPLVPRDIAYLRDENRAFTDVIGEDRLPVTLSSGDTHERVTGAVVTDGFFATLGVQPAAGRLLGPADSTNSDAIVVSSGLASRRFGSAAGALGQTARINQHAFTIVGVAPPEFHSSQLMWSSDIWFPPAAANALTGRPLRESGSSMYVTARLAPGVDIDRANAELATLAARLVAEDSVARRGFTLRADAARGITAEIKSAATAASAFLLAVVGLVLLIACANLANLLMARATSRRREIGVRIALGAGRRRLVRQMLTESALLSVIAGGAGIAAAVFIADALARYVTSRSPEPVYLSFTPDTGVLIFAAGLTAVTTVLFGLLPALRATAPGMALALREDGRQAGASSRTRSTLVGLQVALCTVLLACSTLFLRSLGNAREIEPGFDAAGVIDVGLDVSTRLLDSARRNEFFERVLQRSRELPGVRAASLAQIAPLSGTNMGTGVWLENSDPEARSPFGPYFNVVGAGYFATLGIPLVQGREFVADDRAGRAPTIIVNEEFARRAWPGESALGKRVRVGTSDAALATVVGVAKNTKYNSLGEDTPMYMYLPAAQQYRDNMLLHVRAGGDVAALRAALAAIVREEDPLLPPAPVTLLSEDMRVVLLPAQLGASLLGAFGTLALLLATIGIYGVAAYGVAQRTREFGVRAALGATARDVVRLVLGQSLRTVVIGAAIGIMLSLGVARLLTSQLYGVTPTDPVTFIAMPAFLILVAAAAAFVPARRAMRVQPVEALRSE